MSRENKDISKNSPEISAIEAALAQLRPRREARFADEVKGRVKAELLGETPACENPMATVKIPLTHYIRVAQFNAAASGLLTGLFFGLLVGGLGVFFALDRSYIEPSHSVQSRRAMHSPFSRMLLVNEASLTPQERAWFDELEEEISHVRR